MSVRRGTWVAREKRPIGYQLARLRLDLARAIGKGDAEARDAALAALGAAAGEVAGELVAALDAAVASGGDRARQRRTWRAARQLVRDEGSYDALAEDVVVPARQLPDGKITIAELPPKIELALDLEAAGLSVVLACAIAGIDPSLLRPERLVRLGSRIVKCHRCMCEATNARSWGRIDGADLCPDCRK